MPPRAQVGGPLYIHNHALQLSGVCVLFFFFLFFFFTRWMGRPGGHLVLIWNNRDERVPWVAAMEQQIITPLYPPSVPRQQTGAWRSVFENQALFATPPVTLSADFLQPGGHKVIADRILSLRFAFSSPKPTSLFS